MEPGSISIRYPENVSCVEFHDQGVSCAGGGNIAALSLANGEPMPSNEVETSLATARSNERLVDEPPINPFEALRAQQNNRSANSRVMEIMNGLLRVAFRLRMFLLECVWYLHPLVIDW